MIDITARKQAELEHQRQNMELARVGRVAVMGELAASLAHEVNNPIGAMVANASAGQRLLAAGKIETTELDELLSDIVADGRRAGEIIQGIRNMVRKGKERRSLIQINDMIQDLLRIVHAEALGRGVKVVVEVDPASGPVLADRVQLLQVLLNLTMNGFEAMSVIRSEKRRLVIRAGRNETGRNLYQRAGFWSWLSRRASSNNFSSHSFRRKRKGPEWDWRSRAASSKRTTGRSRGKTVKEGGACFTICLPEAREGQTNVA